MSYRLIISPEANLDIEDAFNWYELQRLGLGSEFVRAVDVALSSIGNNPSAYPTVYRQARRVLLRRFPYALLYVFDSNSISIVACFHGKRDPKQWRERLQ
jgi:plasmid stabilization system protein ParE